MEFAHHRRPTFAIQQKALAVEGQRGAIGPARLAHVEAFGIWRSGRRDRDRQRAGGGGVRRGREYRRGDEGKEQRLGHNPAEEWKFGRTEERPNQSQVSVLPIFQSAILTFFPRRKTRGKP